MSPRPIRTPPVMDLVAGPQGSGKSTFFPVAGRGFDAFNIDDHRRRLHGGSSQGIPDSLRRRATADYEAFIEKHLRGKASFSIEVTLGKDITFEQAGRAMKAGFRVQLTYVAADVEECLRRVANRVDRGGHGVSAAILRETHASSLRNLVRALREFDLVQDYDNSRTAGLEDDPAALWPRMVLEVQGGTSTTRAPDPPAWLKAALAGSPFAVE